MAGPPMTSPPGEAFVQSLARGLAVISAFDADHGRMTLSEVAARCGLSRAAARRLLHTLVGLGYARQEGPRFELTPQVLRLGGAYLSGLGLPQVAQPHLEALSAAVGESSSAAVLDGTDIVYVARVATRRLMGVGITVGTRFPAYATSMGRVLLAGLPRAERDAVLAHTDRVAFTERTVTTLSGLRRVLTEVERAGYALVDQELEPGLRSVAVPVRRGSATVAAVNISTSVASDPIRLETVLPVLLDTAERIGADLQLVT